jgi:transposase
MYFEAQMTDREIALLNEKWDDFEADGSLSEPRRQRPQQPNETEFRMRGHNKDGHPECPQVKIALVCAPGGLIMRHQVYAGNVGDSSITKDLVERLPNPPAGTVRIFVGDAGMVGKDQIAALDEANWHRLTAEPLRKSALGQKLFKAQGGQYKKDPNRSHMSYKVHDVTAQDSPSGKAERWVFTRNAHERERQLEKIERHLDEVAKQLSRKPSPNLVHAKSVCAAVSHISHKKYIKPSDKVPGAFVFNQDAIAWEKRLAGVRLYRTTLTDLDGPAILQMYGELQDVELMNKTLKHPLKLRPCYHRTEKRIRAHIMLTILAANCALYLERKTGLTIEKLRALAADVHAHEIEQGAKRHWQRGEVNAAYQKALESLGIEIPPVVWEAWIEPASKLNNKRRRAS